MNPLASIGIADLRATFSRPADNNAYSAGDLIANSTTASSVLPMSFPTPKAGFITGARCVVTPASSTLVITALDFDLLLFRAVAGVPYAAAAYPADNAAFVLSAAAARELVAVIPFVNTAWRQPTGALTAGATGWQAATLPTRTRANFNVDGLEALIGVLQAKAAWTPTGIVNQFDFVLDCDYK